MVVVTDFIYLTVNNFLSPSKPENKKYGDNIPVCAKIYLSYDFASYILLWENRYETNPNNNNASDATALSFDRVPATSERDS